MTWRKGDRLQGGKYIIEEILGPGGFGITYKALHVDLKQHVVIKTPNEYLKHDPEYDKYIERFFKEGQILAQLEGAHPCIVGVRDMFREGTTQCMVMNYVPGETLLKTVKRRGALPEVEAVQYVRQVGEALIVVHQRGFVHRDIHPGNIIIRPDGRAVLIDFGISKGVVPTTQTSTNHAWNEHFAPYEQRLRGSREPSVDVHSIAATLYYTVTGKLPASSLSRKLDEVTLEPPKLIVSTISGRVNQAILEGMALEAKDRPQTLREWLKLLETPQSVNVPPLPKPLSWPEIEKAIKAPQSVNVPPLPKPPSWPEIEKAIKAPQGVNVPPPSKPPGWPEIKIEKANEAPQGVNMPQSEFKSPEALENIYPPPVEPSNWREEVQPQPRQKSSAISHSKRRQQSRVIPWGWLVGALLPYALIGYGFTAISAPFWIWTVAGAGAWTGAGVVAVAWAGAGVGAVVIAVVIAVAWAVAWAGAGAEAWAMAVSVAWAGTVAWAVSVAWTGTVAWAEAWAVAWAVAWAMAGSGAVAWAMAGSGAVAWAVAWAVVVAREKLLPSFSQFHTSLILAGTSSLGLGLGWLGHWLFSAGNR